MMGIIKDTLLYFFFPRIIRIHLTRFEENNSRYVLLSLSTSYTRKIIINGIRVPEKEHYLIKINQQNSISLKLMGLLAHKEYSYAIPTETFVLNSQNLKPIHKSLQVFHKSKELYKVKNAIHIRNVDLIELHHANPLVVMPQLFKSSLRVKLNLPHLYAQVPILDIDHLIANHPKPSL